MLVTRENLAHAMAVIAQEKKCISLDLETSGLRPYHGDYILGLSVEVYPDKLAKSFYFNFNPHEIIDKSSVFTLDVLKTVLSQIDSQTLVLGANFKFDMRFLAQAGIFLPQRIYDVLVHARTQDNSFFRYSLDACGERIGIQKSTALKDYMKRHKLWSKVDIPGKKTKGRVGRFDLVPVDVMAPYAEQDVTVTRAVYDKQRSVFLAWTTANPSKQIYPLIQNEIALTKVCFEMEHRGMQLDVRYTQRALDYEMERVKHFEGRYFNITGHHLIDSAFSLAPEFTKLGLIAGKTQLGNDSFTDDILSGMDHDLARAVLGYRDAKKRAGSYYSSFLYHADADGVVHCDIKQSATATSRFSIRDPALQTLTSEEDTSGSYFKIRNCFVARPGFKLCAIDYKAFEFRAMLDMAGEKGLADRIEAGEDPHQTTADIVGITRKQAKTINFGLLYGMGAGKLAGSLGVSVAEAKAMKATYFAKLPKVKSLIYQAQREAETSGFVFNRFNRRYFFHDSQFAYKALNYLIQGGTADAVKHAMVRCHEYLKARKSKMLLQIHDEIIFEIHESELDIVPDLKDIMRKAYPSIFHPMDCDESFGDRWGEL